MPGEEELVKTVTSTAVAHYERTTEFDHAPFAERARVTRAMLSLADVALKLGRPDDAASPLALGQQLAQGLLAEGESVDSLLLLAECRGVEARLAQSREHGVDSELPLVQDGLSLVERALALAPNDVRGNVLAAKLTHHLGGLVPPEETGATLQRAVDFAGKALAVAPGDLDAQLAQARSLSLMASASEVAADPQRRRGLVERAVALLRAAQKKAPDAAEVRVALVDVLVQHGTLLELDGDVEGSRRALSEARRGALSLLEHQPESVDVMPALVEAEVNLGLVREAWQHLRTMEHRGALGDLVLVAPGVAFLVGDDDEAMRLARLPAIESSGAALVYRALAAAMQGRPGDALVAARAARGKAQFVPWRKGLVYARVVTSGRLDQPGPLAAFHFALAYDAALPVTDVAPLDAALERFIAELEAQLPR
jgi:hypothetical protein